MTDTPIDQLISLVAGELDEAEARGLRERVCASEQGRTALAELEQIAAFLREEGGVIPPASVVERAKRELARLKPGIANRFAEGVRSFLASLDFDSRFAPAAAGFRGVSEVAQVAFTAEPCEIDLELQTGEGGRTALRGQVSSDDPAGWSLSFVDAAGGVAGAVEAGPDGSFRVELGPGRYTIELTRGDVRVEAGPLPLP